MLYDEMYQSPAVGIVKEHQKYFPNVRARLAEDELGETPAKIEQAFNKYLQRPPSQRDPTALARMLKYADWQQRSWGDFATRMVKVGKELAPRARFGTYTRTWACRAPTTTSTTATLPTCSSRSTSSPTSTTPIMPRAG